MPLTPIYKWTENENNIQITIDNVPIKDQSQLFCSDRVVKLNAPPYLLLLDLKGAIDDDRSTATVIHNRRVVFQLSKAEPGLWGSLTAQGDKQAIKQQREESVKRAHEKQVAAQQERLARKQKEEKAAIEHQIAQERAQRARIEALKQQELQQERQQLQQWQHQQQSQQQLLETGDESDYEDDLQDNNSRADAVATAAAASVPCPQDVAPDHPDYHGRGWRASNSAAATASQQDKQQVKQQDRQQGKQLVEKQDGQQDEADDDSSMSSSKCLAAAADGQQITLTAPCSTAHQASVMHRLVSEAAAAGGHKIISSSSSSSSSRSPEHTIWGATDICQPAAAAGGAGSEQLLTVAATKTAAKPEAAAAAAAQSAAAAVIASKPPVPVRCRAEPVAVNFTQLETPHLPAREQREVEFKGIKRTRDKSDSVDVADRQPAFLKDKGDALALQGNYRGAINAYSRALELDPTQAALWANRAACHLALGQAAECVQDCTAAADLLQNMQQRLMEAAGAPDAEQELLAGLLPPAAPDLMQGAALSSADTAAGVGANVSGSLAAAKPVAAAADEEEELQVVGAADRRTAVENGGSNAHSTALSALEVEEQQQQEKHIAISTAESKAVPAASSSRLSEELSPEVVAGAAVHNVPLAASSSSTTNKLSSEAAGAAAAGVAAGAAVHKIMQQLVKVLARRAAARVELQQLQEAADDLQQAVRLDPDNPELKADALEVAAALQPRSSTQPDSWKQRGDARFKAGDIPGAAEAYTTLIQVLTWRQQQQQQQQQQRKQPCLQQKEQQEALAAAGAEQQQQSYTAPTAVDSTGCGPQQQHVRQLLAAYSNRAACWLSLEDYQQCVDDCIAALLLALGQGNIDEAVTAVATAPAAATAAAEQQDSCTAAPGRQSPSQQQQHQNLLLMQQLLQQCTPGQLLEQEGTARVKSVARLLGRAAVAYGCLKQLQPAVQLYSWAQQYWLAVGDDRRAAELAADQSRLQQLAGGQTGSL